MIQVLSAALLWGFAGAFAARLMGGTLEPSILVPLRFFGSFVVLVPLLWRFPPQQKEVLRLLAIALALTLTQASYYLAIYQSSVATGLFLQYMAPVLLTVYALLRGEHLSQTKLLGLGLAIVGAYFLVVGPQGLVGGMSGIAYGLASAVLFATFSYLGMGMRSHPLTVLGIAMGVGSLLSIPLTPWQKVWSLSALDFAAVAYIVVLGTVVPFGLFLWGVQKIPARVATLVAMIEPICGAIFAIFLVGQLLSPLAMFGGGLILCGVWLNTSLLRST